MDNGYEEARNLLSQRYGSESALAAAFVDQFENLCRLKPDDIEGLDHFALQLMKCKNAFRFNSTTMSDPRTLRSISAKLPVHSQHKWRYRADAINEDERRSVVFEDLVNFVVKEARVATNPAFGSRAGKTAEKQGYPSSFVRTRKGPLVAATHVMGGGTLSCFHCQDQKHELTDCSNFASLPHQEKVEIIQRSALCFACLKRGHRSADCKRHARCQICDLRHPTSLHIDRAASSELNVPNVTSCRTKSESSPRLSPALPIVPVVFHHGCNKETTYAGPTIEDDSGSTHSFISEQMVSRMNLQHMPQARLSLTTIDREVSITARTVKGAWLSDINGENALHLPLLFFYQQNSG